MFDALSLLGDILLRNSPTVQRHVLETVERQRIGGQTVAARAADFLIIGLDAAGHVGVSDEANIRLVDAHAEGDRGDGEDPVLLQETVAVAVAHHLVETGVISNGRVAAAVEEFGEPFRPLARSAIDDAALAAMTVEEM